MSKKGEGMRALVINILTESEIPLRSSIIAERLHTTTRLVVTAIASIKSAKIPDFYQREIDGVMLYAMGEGKLPMASATPGTLFLPDNIGRGWFNPQTGSTGSKLGA